PARPAQAQGVGQGASVAHRASDRRERAQQWRERMRAKQEAEQTEALPEVGGGFPSLSDEEIRARFEAMSAALEQDPETGPVREYPLPPFLEAVLDLLTELDTDGLHRQVLADHLTVGDKEWVSKLMKALQVKPWEGTFRMSGHPGFGSARGWKRDAIEAAAAQIRSGKPV